MKDKILITLASLEEDKDKMFTLIRDDEQLIRAIDVFARDLVTKGVEIFDRQKNVLVTEEGYYMAFYEKDVIYKSEPKNED